MDSIKQDPNKRKLLVKLQSVIRGMQYREKHKDSEDKNGTEKSKEKENKSIIFDIEDEKEEELSIEGKNRKGNKKKGNRGSKDSDIDFHEREKTGIKIEKGLGDNDDLVNYIESQDSELKDKIGESYIEQIEKENKKEEKKENKKCLSPLSSGFMHSGKIYKSSIINKSGNYEREGMPLLKRSSNHFKSRSIELKEGFIPNENILKSSLNCGISGRRRYLL